VFTVFGSKIFTVFLSKEFAGTLRVVETVMVILEERLPVGQSAAEFVGGERAAPFGCIEDGSVEALGPSE
jgi:hypothetical protein